MPKHVQANSLSFSIFDGLRMIRSNKVTAIKLVNLNTRLQTDIFLETPNFIF